MRLGTIQRWNDRGFGFISDDTQPQSRWNYVHISSIPGRIDPAEGDAFSYQIRPGREGREAAFDLVPLTAAREEADRVFGAG